MCTCFYATEQNKRGTVLWLRASDSTVQICLDKLLLPQNGLAAFKGQGSSPYVQALTTWMFFSLNKKHTKVVMLKIIQYGELQPHV